WETFARSIGGFATPAAEGLAAILEPWAGGRKTLEILDVACGGGQYSLAVAAHNDHARVTLLDWPNVLEVTRGHVEELGMADRTSYVEGDMFEVPLGGPYDLIITSHVYHHFSEERCVELLERLAAALQDGGRRAIVDGVLHRLIDLFGGEQRHGPKLDGSDRIDRGAQRGCRHVVGKVGDHVDVGAAEGEVERLHLAARALDQLLNGFTPASTAVLHDALDAAARVRPFQED